MPKQLLFDSTVDLAAWINSEFSTGKYLEIRGKNGWFIRDGGSVRHNRCASLINGVIQSAGIGHAAAFCTGHGLISYSVDKQGAL